MKKLLLLATSLFAAGTSQAQFSGPFDVSNWNELQYAGNTTVTANGTSSITFNFPGGLTSFYYYITMPLSCNVAFDYAMTGDYQNYQLGLDFNNNAALADFAGYVGPASGSIDVSSFFGATPQSGQTFAFYALDYNGYGTGPATFTISNFSAGTPTPIVLSSFEGTPLASGNLLTWTSVYEAGMDCYVLERSTDGKTFKTVGTLKASGAGRSYRMTDAMKNPTSYYRLRVQNLDGSATYSHTVSINADAVGKGGLFPNPATDRVTYTNPQASADAVVTLADFTGKVLLQQPIVGGAVTFLTTDLPAGLYAIQCKDAVRSEVLKFRKL